MIVFKYFCFNKKDKVYVDNDSPKGDFSLVDVNKIDLYIYISNSCLQCNMVSVTNRSSKQQQLTSGNIIAQ